MGENIKSTATSQDSAPFLSRLLKQSRFLYPTFPPLLVPKSWHRQLNHSPLQTVSETGTEGASREEQATACVVSGTTAGMKVWKAGLVMTLAFGQMEIFKRAKAFFLRVDYDEGFYSPSDGK